MSSACGQAEPHAGGAGLAERDHEGCLDREKRADRDEVGRSWAASDWK